MKTRGSARRCKPPRGCVASRRREARVPELPEVETICRLVETNLVGRRITRIDLGLPKLMRSSPLPDLDAIVGESVVRARRQAKILVLDFSNGLSLLAHFKLSGQLAIQRPD